MDSIEIFKITGFFVIVFLICFMWYHMSAQSNNAKRTQEAAEEIERRVVAKFPEYEGKLLIGGDTLSLFANPDTRTALVATDEFAKEIPFENFVSASIKTDGTTSVETRKTGMAGRVVGGGLLAGGAGAIVGALSAKTMQTNITVTTAINLVIEIKDDEFPMLSWGYFTPVGMVQDLKPHEVWIYMKNAVADYNKLEVLFERQVTEDNGLVRI